MGSDEEESSCVFHILIVIPSDRLQVGRAMSYNGHDPCWAERPTPGYDSEIQRSLPNRSLRCPGADDSSSAQRHVHGSFTDRNVR